MHAGIAAGRLIADRYRLGGPIGRGAIGIVWRGRDELLARDVAVKEVQISDQATPADAEASYQRTLREARAAAGLKLVSRQALAELRAKPASTSPALARPPRPGTGFRTGPGCSPDPT